MSDTPDSTVSDVGTPDESADLTAVYRELTAGVTAGTACVDALLSFMRERAAAARAHAQTLSRLASKSSLATIGLTDKTASVPPPLAEALQALRSDTTNESVQYEALYTSLHTDVIAPLVALRDADADAVSKLTSESKLVTRDLTRAYSRCDKAYGKYVTAHGRAVVACTSAGVAPPVAWSIPSIIRTPGSASVRQEVQDVEETHAVSGAGKRGETVAAGMPDLNLDGGDAHSEGAEVNHDAGPPPLPPGLPRTRVASLSVLQPPLTAAAASDASSRSRAGSSSHGRSASLDGAARPATGMFAAVGAVKGQFVESSPSVVPVGVDALNESMTSTSGGGGAAGGGGGDDASTGSVDSGILSRALSGVSGVQVMRNVWSSFTLGSSSSAGHAGMSTAERMESARQAAAVATSTAETARKEVEAEWEAYLKVRRRYTGMCDATRGIMASMKARRTDETCDALRRYTVFISSCLANLQYDVNTLATAIESAQVRAQETPTPAPPPQAAPTPPRSPVMSPATPTSQTAPSSPASATSASGSQTSAGGGAIGRFFRMNGGGHTPSPLAPRTHAATRSWFKFAATPASAPADGDGGGGGGDAQFEPFLTAISEAGSATDAATPPSSDMSVRTFSLAAFTAGVVSPDVRALADAAVRALNESAPAVRAFSSAATAAACAHSGACLAAHMRLFADVYGVALSRARDEAAWPAAAALMRLTHTYYTCRAPEHAARTQHTCVRVFLYAYVRGHPLWRDKIFWDAVIRDVHAQARARKEVLVARMGVLTYTMTSFLLEPEFIMSIVSSHAAVLGLASADVAQIKTSVLAFAEEHARAGALDDDAMTPRGAIAPGFHPTSSGT